MHNVAQNPSKPEPAEWMSTDYCGDLSVGDAQNWGVPHPLDFGGSLLDATLIFLSKDPRIEHASDVAPR